MKQITLVRHAKSSWHRGLRDIDRPLNARGERDAPLMAMHLRKQGFSPDILISSPATRAATTAEEIARGIGYDTDACCRRRFIACVARHKNSFDARRETSCP